MDIEANLKSLERRYQELSRDFKAGKIDEATFTAEVDRLQFQDSWGRYWMLGAQSGMWHYYDGQAWQQADPRQADRLPFMDDQGRYWQRGVKSGDWYYYQPSTGEWIKPGESDPLAAPSMGWEQARRQSPAYVPDQTQLQPQQAEAGPGMPGQLDGQLYQDDEGRYWAIGEKSGQWYFFDQDGWHPAHEFGSGQVSHQPYSQPYQPQPDQPAAGYTSPGSQTTPHQPYSAAAGPVGQPGTGPMPVQSYVVQSPSPSSPSQPIQIYITSPGQDMHAGSSQTAPHHVIQAQTSGLATAAGVERAEQSQVVPPAETQAGASDKATPSTLESETPDVGQRPDPPKARSDSGSWFYYDGQQWLKYSSDEDRTAAEAVTPPPGTVIDQKPKAAKAEPKSEPVVAELFEEEDEPEVEVVDVEVITVIEPEPQPTREPKPEPKATPSPPSPAQEPAPTPTPQPTTDEVPPRRTSQPTEVPRRQQELDQTVNRSRKRTIPEPGRAAPPRKRESAHEPTIIIPTGAAASSISARSGTPTRGSRPVKPAPAQQRRARENTLPMKPAQRVEPTTPAEKHRSMTQPMPVVTGAAARRSDSTPMKPQTAQEKAEAVATPVTKVVETQPEKEGFTLGDVFRSIPSTVWTAVGGVAILLACAVGLIFTWSWLQGDDLGTDGLVAVPSLTPTLDAGPPDATPTPGPTPSAALDIDVTATSAAMALFSSEELGYSVEYPENWEQTEDNLCGVFSPSTGGLDPDSLTDAAMWICKSAEDDAAISEILTDVLASFPSDAETLNEGTISIASQVWTSAQVRFDDEDLGGQGIATLAVTNKDKVGYYLVAVAPSETWNAVQPQFQKMINSFSFSTEAVARAITPSPATTGTENEGDTSSEATSTRQATRQANSTPRSTPTPKGTATPLVYSIQSGDTLLEIAQRFGVTVDLLVTKNDIDDPESLQIGQELIIPFTAEELEAYNEGRTVASTDSDDTEAELEGATEADTDTPAGSSSEDAAETTTAAQAEPEDAPSDAAPLSGRIVYGGFNPGTNVYDLWMADVATGEQTIIATEASQPAFNKDGSLLAYRSWNLGNRGIFFRDFIGGREGLVTRFVEDGLPAWTSDGFSFVFSSRREGDRVPRIYVGNQQGDGDYGIGFQGEYADTFPDGRIVVKGCSPSGDCGTYVMGGTGGGEVKITGEGSDTAPAVSPDGNKIAFMSSGRGATNWEIWVMNADGSNPQRLTENGSNDGLPTWSPDGQSIAYVSDQGGVWAIWAMNADGSNQRKLFNMKGSPDGQVLRDIDNSKGWLEERISWAP